ncbi:hypothetical protein F5X96DRAFT_642439 [Biscogniauxia mediterranea]|nr:hypothetical protein F5X96DRAFT_642439 [Biscogniauxia mediterranea]
MRYKQICLCVPLCAALLSIVRVKRWGHRISINSTDQCKSDQPTSKFGFKLLTHGQRGLCKIYKSSASAPEAL